MLIVLRIWGLWHLELGGGVKCSFILTGIYDWPSMIALSGGPTLDGPTSWVQDGPDQDASENPHENQ